jgi:hypothetical protein
LHPLSLSFMDEDDTPQEELDAVLVLLDTSEMLAVSEVYRYAHGLEAVVLHAQSLSEVQVLGLGKFRGVTPMDGASDVPPLLEAALTAAERAALRAATGVHARGTPLPSTRTTFCQWEGSGIPLLSGRGWEWAAAWDHSPLLFCLLLPWFPPSMMTGLKECRIHPHMS